MEEERDQKEKERFQAEANLRAAIERTRAESLEEQKRQHEISARLQKQQQDMIFDLQVTYIQFSGHNNTIVVE